MGRIKTKLVKRLTVELISRHGIQLSSGFDDNKKVINERLDAQSKKLRNVIAGYATRLKRRLSETQ